MKIVPSLFLAAAVAAAPVSAFAEDSVGVSFTLLFNGEASIGVKYFPTENEDTGTVSFGLDYNLTNNSWRPNVGAAYLQERSFVDVNVGYDLGREAFDYGASIGVYNGKGDKGDKGDQGAQGPAAPPVVF